MAKSLEQEYRFQLVDGIKVFESRYYAQKYLDEVHSLYDPDDLCDFYYVISKSPVGDGYCIFECYPVK